MGEDLTAKIERLTNFESVSMEYGSMWARSLEDIISKKDAAEHGESPTWTRILAISRNERFIEYLPLFEQARHLALVDFVIENNRNLLNVVQELIAHSRT